VRRYSRLLRIVILLGPLLYAVAAWAEDRPNLVILAIDTLRADHVGCYGYPRPTTPGIDRLAALGTRFDQVLSTAPWTLPSFATMFTGRYPTRHGAELSGTMRNLAEEVPTVITPEAPTLTEILHDHGYRTAAFTSNPYLLFGVQRGFERFVCRSIAADRVGALARSWLDRQPEGEPFFLFCHFNDPHEPTDTPDAYLRALGYGSAVLDDPHRKALERWGSPEEGGFLGHAESRAAARDLLRTKEALYDGAVLQVDLEIARIVEQLQRQGVFDRTLVVVVSDHGEEFLDHVEAERALDVDPRAVWGIGHGHSLFQELLRVPLILVGPGVKPDRVIEQQMSLVDLMPTLLGLLGVPGPSMEAAASVEASLGDVEAAAYDGRDRRSWMDDPDRVSLPAGAESTAYGPDLIAWSDGRMKLICDRSSSCLWAFDLREDPTERTDLLPVPEAWQPLRPALLAWSDALLATAPPPTDRAALTDSMRDGLKSLGYLQ
jgi:arylsulfatase A-like enzyme